MEATGFRELPLSSPQNKYFQLVANFQPDQAVINILSKSIDLVLKSPGFTERKVNKLTVFITNSNSININYTNQNQYGSQFNAAVILYSRMAKLSDLQKLICCVEEFVHHFWSERDEVETSKIVCTLIPELTCNEKGEYSKGT